jgi:hypothetical protein
MARRIRMLEREMEDLIANYPDDFFPHKGFQLRGRQRSFANVGRFDLLFKDRYDTNILMELKAVPAKYEVATQLAKYKDELHSRGEKHILMWLVAPQVPNSVREFLDRIGIEYSEIHTTEFRRVAEHHGVLIASETSPQQPVGCVDPTVRRSQTSGSKGSTKSSPQTHLGSKVIYDSFSELMESRLLPQRAASPTHLRLDGAQTGGNLEVAGRFRHHRKVWRIHADTHYEPLMIAYDAIKKDKTCDPFVEESTPHGNCLVLRDTFLRSMTVPRFKHIYIYEDPV